MRPTLVSCAAISSFLWSAVHAASCITFDSSWNLYTFGIGGADYNLGAQSTWSEGSATKLTTSGRPPFDGGNTQCFLSQFQNAIYVIDGDRANPSDIHLYDVSASSWSTQKTNLAGVDPTSLVAILDHDTNVFFALSNGTLFQLDFGSMKAAVSTTLSWDTVEAPPFSTDNYKPVMALAQNHIHFIDVPGSSAGQAYIFVIHNAFFQPEVEDFPAASGSSFPAAHGQTATFFLEDSWQEQFAFIPDDGSATYVVNVQNNSTLPLAGPSDKSSGSVYAASTSALVQLTSSGALSYIPYSQTGGASSNSKAAWSAINVSGYPTGGSGGNSTSTGSAGPSGTKGSSPTGSGGASPTGQSGSGTRTSSGPSPTESPNGAVQAQTGTMLMMLLCIVSTVLGGASLFISI